MQEEINHSRITCYKCRRPSTTCVCTHINAIQTNTHFVILMHPKEYKKEKNGTGHMTNLQLENSEIIVGVDFTNNKRVNAILNQANSTSFLLYPGKDSFNLSTGNSAAIHTLMGITPYLFLLDGTWPCARKMLKLSKNLQQLKRVSFDNKIASKFIFKQQPEALCLSTIESVFTVLNLLKESKFEKCDTKDFLMPFEKMIAHQLLYILNPEEKYDHSVEKREMLPKNRYKKNHERSVIFEQIGK